MIKTYKKRKWNRFNFRKLDFGCRKNDPENDIANDAIFSLTSVNSAPDNEANTNSKKEK